MGARRCTAPAATTAARPRASCSSAAPTARSRTRGRDRRGRRPANGRADLAAYIDGFGSAARLYDAAGGDGTEANFLEVLRGCGEAEVKYRGARGGITVLMRMACLHDWPKAAAAVIERGCDVNATNNAWSTALHIAGTINNRRETARVLLERGADRTIKSRGRPTAAGDARHAQRRPRGVHRPALGRAAAAPPVTARRGELPRGAPRGEAAGEVPRPSRDGADADGHQPRLAVDAARGPHRARVRRERRIKASERLHSRGTALHFADGTTAARPRASCSARRRPHAQEQERRDRRGLGGCRGDARRRPRGVHRRLRRA